MKHLSVLHSRVGFWPYPQTLDIDMSVCSREAFPSQPNIRPRANPRMEHLRGDSLGEALLETLDKTGKACRAYYEHPIITSAKSFVSLVPRRVERRPDSRRWRFRNFLARRVRDFGRRLGHRILHLGPLSEPRRVKASPYRENFVKFYDCNLRL